MKKKPAKKPSLTTVTSDLKRLLMAEIDNEADGGDSPATLKSAADSLAGGYTPYDGFPVAKVKKELAALIGKRGNARAERFVSDADFIARRRMTQAEKRNPKAAKKSAKKAAKKRARKTNTFETTVEVCCHRVALRYWDFTSELTDGLREELENHGEERAKECINNDCREGELNCLHVNEDDSDEEIRGWWEIERD